MSSSAPTLRAKSAAPLNRKYLRVIHPHPVNPAASSPRQKRGSTIVALNVGDIILVHLTNANGWAEGTVLNTGKRGWFPANFCTSYDHPHARHFFHGLTRVWTTATRSRDGHLVDIESQCKDGPLVHGVRHVLEQTGCLWERDDLPPSVKGVRTGLLSDLSKFVKHEHFIVEQVQQGESHGVFSQSVDRYISLAFRLAVRVVRFIEVSDKDDQSSTSVEDDSEDERKTMSPHDSFISPPLAAKRSVIGSMRSDTTLGSPTPTGASSYTASELLAFTRTQFFENIGSLLGVFMQSQSSGQIDGIVTRTLESSSTFAALVEDICSHWRSPSAALDGSATVFHRQLTALSLILLPRTASPQSPPAQSLISVATACIRAAARVATEAKQCLDENGDYPISPNKLILSARAHTERLTARQDHTGTSHLSPPLPSQERSPHSPTLWMVESSVEKSGAVDARSTEEKADHSPGIVTHAVTTTEPLKTRRPKGVAALILSAVHDRVEEDKRPVPSPGFARLDTTTAWRQSKIVEESGRIYAHEMMLGPNDRILGGTQRALVEHLMHSPDEDYVRAFLMTRKSFMSDVDFVTALISQYNTLKPQADTYRAKAEHIFEMIMLWLSRIWVSELDIIALNKLEIFICSDYIDLADEARKRLLNRIADTRWAQERAKPPILPALDLGSIITEKTKDRPASREKVPAPDHWADRTLVTDFCPVEMARQLTLLVYKTFSRISPAELMESIPAKAQSESSHVKAMTGLSTTITNLVSSTIVLTADLKKRVMTLKQWIKVGQACLVLQNYDTLMAIMCALNSTAILRLSQTWAHLTIKVQHQFQELKELTEFNRNFAHLRQRLKTAKAPCLPFLGIFLTDLTFVDAGNPSTRTLPHTIDSAHPIEVVNFDKYMRTSSILETIRSFQQPYRLREVNSIQKWLTTELERIKTQDDLWGFMFAQSLEIEPRERPDSMSERSSNVLTKKVTSPLIDRKLSATEASDTDGKSLYSIRKRPVDKARKAQATTHYGIMGMAI